MDNTVSYGDDTTALTKGNTWEELNKIDLNIDKTVHITFGNYCNSVPLNMEIRITNKILNGVQNYKYSGVIIDFNLKWNKHIEFIINKAKYPFIFHKLAKFMDSKMLMVVMG